MIPLFEDPDAWPGVTLYQPYAGLVRLGLKTLETREFRINYRGPLVICAGVDVDEKALMRLYRELVPSRCSADDFDRAVGLRGVLAAIGNVVHVRPLVAADYPRALFFDALAARHAWELEQVRALVPRPWRGRPGFSRIPRSLVRAA